MTSLTRNQTGSHLIAIAVGVVVVGIAAAAGYNVAQKFSDDASQTTVSASTTPATIETKADLQQAATALDSSSADIDSSVNGDTLNADLNDLQ